MWKNWNPFRKRTLENSNSVEEQDETSNGKENSVDVNMVSRSLNDTTDGSGNGRYTENNTNQNIGLHNSASGPTNCYGRLEDISFNQSYSNDGTFSDVSGRLENQLDPKVTEVRSRHFSVYPRASSVRRPVTSPYQRDEDSHLQRDASFNTDTENLNRSFTGVSYPMLSTSFVPKVRRALESNAGLRSPQTAALRTSKPLGRSASLNYHSTNPIKSTAGQVPWVCLKKWEPITLSDIVSGNTPQSPNTVKLAAPEPRFLPSAPSFKSTPLIVTTEHNRSRMVDTQTVVSALREKTDRKRFGTSLREDSLSEDSWVNAAKRRRQDSSQSNASSASIPSMPESLPNLMGTPGVSLLHIENLKDQRPSTVPAMDSFVSHHQREFGLGGDLGGHKPSLQVYSQHQQQQLSQHEDQDMRNKQNSRTVLRSIQSSLSSSQRARTNMSLLQQNNLDMNLACQISEGHQVSQVMPSGSDVSMLDQRFTF